MKKSEKVSYLIVDRLLTIRGCSFHRSSMGVSILLPRFRRRIRMSIRRIRRGFQQGTGTGIVINSSLRVVGSIASWQWWSCLARGRSDRFSTFYQFHYLVSFPRKVTVWSEWIIPTTIRAGNEFFPVKSSSPKLGSKYQILLGTLSVSLIILPMVKQISKIFSHVIEVSHCFITSE